MAENVLVKKYAVSVYPNSKDGFTHEIINGRRDYIIEIWKHSFTQQLWRRWIPMGHKRALSSDEGYELFKSIKDGRSVIKRLLYYPENLLKA